MTTFKKEHEQWHNDNAGKYPIALFYHEALRNHFKDWQLVEKPVIQQFVADWYEAHKDCLEYAIWDYIRSWSDKERDEFFNFMDKTGAIETLINMHQYGYEVYKPKEKRYKVKFGYMWLTTEPAPNVKIGWDRTLLEQFAGIFTKQELAEIADGAFLKIGLPEEMVVGGFLPSILQMLGWKFDDELNDWTKQFELIELVEVEE